MRKDAPALAGAPTVSAAATASPSDVRRSPRLGVARLDERRGGALLRLLGGLAIVTLLAATLGIVVTAAHAPSILVARSTIVFPHWEVGPLGDLFTPPFSGPTALGNGFTITLAAMCVAYAVMLVTARRMPTAVIVLAVVALHAILLLGPPMQLTDVFNYLGYARLGALHGLDPYTHSISAESFDPVFRFASWDGLESPYGELFTMLTYPLAFLPLPLAYWILKAAMVLLSLGFLWLVWRCAQRLGRDPRAVVAFVALNPIYLIYAVGGFHNDFLMLMPSMAAIAFVLAGRDRSAGASLMLAIAVKFTAVVLGPFLLVAVATRRRCLRIVAGGVAMLVPLLAASLALFGASVPNLSQQSRLLSNSSIPNLVGLPFGVGGSPLVLHLATLAVALVAVHQLLRRRDDWLAGAGWTTFALILSLSWSVPWYVIWMLPLAALSGRPALRAAALALTLFLLFAYAPVTNNYINQHNVPLLSTPAGQASRSLQFRLAN